MRLHRLLAGIGLALAQPVAAQEVPPEVDRVLWCASAFYWLAGSADDSGEPQEAELYDSWSVRLLEQAAASLHATGVASDRIEALIAEYDEAVLEELAGPAPRHEVGGCQALVTTGN